MTEIAPVSPALPDGDEVRAALLSTARDLGTPGADQFYGAGCLDAAAALVFCSTRFGGGRWIGYFFW